MTRLIRRLSNQRGTSTLEFLVVLPTLLFIFLASLELSRAWLTANIATNAAREGARVGVVTPPPDPNNPSFNNGPALTRMTEILSAANLTATTSVTCSSAACPPDSQVQASVTINFETIVPLFLPILGTPSSPLVLQETVKMRRE
ncbi:MAG TPA: TadE family protein [Gemmatimonadales bacterium]|jgi:TadE-like protein|nr:TadE family protein [Gemmatimonadales bacterium]